MYRLLGKDKCLNVGFSLSLPFLDLDDPAEMGPEAWKRAYARYLHRVQPDVPPQSEPGVVLVEDEALEQVLIKGFLNESVLDDFDYYRDDTYFEAGAERRAQIFDDIAHMDRMLGEFAPIDPDFWRAFGFYINYLMCPYSRFSSGGTDSAVIGVIFLSGPRQYGPKDLYEILVHEFSHTVMFLDEHISPHYRNEHLMPLKETFARAAISGLRRPLDKVLHSLVVSTEVLLHREHVIGHDGETRIHPPTPQLLDGVFATIDSLWTMPYRDDLLDDRGLDLIDRCFSAASDLAGWTDVRAAGA